MSIVHRDVSPAERSQQDEQDKKFVELLEDIKAGKLEEEKITALKESLGIITNA